MAGALSSEIYGALLGDAEVAELLSDRAHIRAMLAAEAALARAQAAVGMVPPTAAEEIAAVARTLTIDPRDLAEPTAEAGVPVIALVARLRDAVSAVSADHVHRGATSQDIMDTALVLTMRGVLNVLQQRMDRLMGVLATLAREHRGSLMAGRTRTQQAVPTTFGAKVAAWISALLRHRSRLGELRSRLLVVQLGGAAGTLAPFGEKAKPLTEAFAAQLDLGVPVTPWHSQRDTIAELGGWLASLASILGKTGQDLALLCQSEVAEVRFAGGGSSTMPQKANPVLAEALVAIARHASGLSANLQQCVVAGHERDGAAWTAEWLALPDLAELAATSLRHGLSVAETVQVDVVRMRSNLDIACGTIVAEAASFALAKHMPRAQAKDLVSRGCAECVDNDQMLIDWLRDNVDVDVDWDAVGDPSNWTGNVEEMIDRVCAEADQVAGS